MGALDEAIIAILEDPIAERINFRIDRVPVYGSGFRIVARGIRHRRILCFENPRLRAGREPVARYRHAAGPNRVNTLEVPDSHFPTVVHRALLVHEAVHALNDWHRRPLNVLLDESAAFIAQAYYLLQSGLAAPEQPSDSVVGWAIRIAHRIRTTAGGYEVTPDEATRLGEHILALDQYSRAHELTRDYDRI